jgi:gliding motility-associated-like protein
LPLPDGKAFVAIRQSVYRKPDYTETDIAKTYMSQCLPKALQPGTSYTLSFNTGRFQSNDDSAFIYKLEPITVAVFGHADCNAAPFGQPYANSNGCAANYNGWTLLGKTTLRSKGAWTQGKINFTVPNDINVIAIGPDCTKIIPSTELSDSTTVLDYYVYYLDDVHLLPTEEFHFPYIEPASGNVCIEDSVLNAPVLANAAYQWYKDSIAVVGATGRTYQVPASERNGTYNVRISRDGGCAISEPFSMQPNNLARLQIPRDTVLCSNDSVQLAPPLDGIIYKWNGLRTANVVVQQPGTYTITAEAGSCSKTMTVAVHATNCSTIYMPNASTPNGDGRNDVFRIPVQTNLKVQQFSIYDRWGQVVFNTANSSTSWDGTYNGKACAPGTYVYFIKGVFNNKEQIVKGVVSLIR